MELYELVEQSRNDKQTISLLAAEIRSLCWSLQNDDDKDRRVRAEMAERLLSKRGL